MEYYVQQQSVISVDFYCILDFFLQHIGYFFNYDSLLSPNRIVLYLNEQYIEINNSNVTRFKINYTTDKRGEKMFSFLCRLMDVKYIFPQMLVNSSVLLI